MEMLESDTFIDHTTERNTTNHKTNILPIKNTQSSSEIQFRGLELNVSPSMTTDHANLGGETYYDGYINDDNKTEMTDNYTKDLDLVS